MARNFDGTVSQLEVSDDVALTPSDKITWGIWARPVGAQDDFGNIIRKGISNPSYLLQQNGSNVREYLSQLRIGGVNKRANAAHTALVDEEWHLFFGRWSSGGVVKLDIYDSSATKVVDLDGDSATGTIDSNTSSLRFGFESSSASFRWAGDLAESFLFDVELTDDQLQGFAWKSVARRLVAPSNLSGYWPIWGLHSPEIDLSGNGNNLTVTSAARANHPPITPFTPKWAATVPLIETVAAEIPAARPAWNYRLHA